MDSRDKIKSEITALLEDGRNLYTNERRYWTARQKSDNDEIDASEIPERPQFAYRYHQWYSAALPLVRQLASERADEFESYFRNGTERPVNVGVDARVSREQSRGGSARA